MKMKTTAGDAGDAGDVSNPSRGKCQMTNYRDRAGIIPFIPFIPRTKGKGWSERASMRAPRRFEARKPLPSASPIRHDAGSRPMHAARRQKAECFRAADSQQTHRADSSAYRLPANTATLLAKTRQVHDCIGDRSTVRRCRSTRRLS